MIYQLPDVGEPVDQADLIEGCPILSLADGRLEVGAAAGVEIAFQRILVLSQTCDLANQKTTIVNVAVVSEARQLVDGGILKAIDVKGPLRAGRIWGMYFLPAATALGLAEMIVDLRGLHTIRLDVLQNLC